MKEIPNIHLFEVYERKFLYDIDTNSIMEIPKEYMILYWICLYVRVKQN